MVLICSNDEDAMDMIRGEYKESTGQAVGLLLMTPSLFANLSTDR